MKGFTSLEGQTNLAARKNSKFRSAGGSLELRHLAWHGIRKAVLALDRAGLDLVTLLAMQTSETKLLRVPSRVPAGSEGFYKAQYTTLRG